MAIHIRITLKNCNGVKQFEADIPIVDGMKKEAISSSTEVLKINLYELVNIPKGAKILVELIEIK